MFRSCCSRPRKEHNDKHSKSKATESCKDLNIQTEDTILQENISIVRKRLNSSDITKKSPNTCTMKREEEFMKGEEDQKCRNLSSTSTADIAEDAETISPHEDGPSEREFRHLSLMNELYMKKRLSVDYKRYKNDFKRYSVDLRPSTATLQELNLLEEQLTRANVDVRPGLRRKSSGILKSTSEYDTDPQRNKFDICSDDDDVFEPSSTKCDGLEGTKEQPATPVGRDELALRRHRFFSDLVCAARAAVEHRVRFDPLGPAVVADSGNDTEPSEVAHCPASELEALIERLERVTSRLEKLPLLCKDLPPSQPSQPSPAPTVQSAFIDTDNMSVNGYQDIVQGPLRTYLTLSQQIGGDVATHANLVNAAFQAQLSYIQLAASRSKPAQHEEGSLLAPTSEKINAIQQFREKNRTSQFFNHLSAISESIPALGWVAVSPTPAPYVKEMNDAGQFYTNRVLKDWKEKDKRHAEWCRAWVQLLSDLQVYVKQHHTTGLVWSGKGGAPPPPPAGLPPPPPMLPEVDFSSMSVDDRSALFAQINQGEGIANNLRKVTADMQTHKNPTLRSGPAPFKPPTAAPHKPPTAAPHKPLPIPGAGHLDKPPVFSRDGKKWLIEYQKGNPNLVVENADMNNVVYMFRCRDSALTVKGKINGVVLDSCTKCAVVFDNLVSSIEFVNCQSVQMQVLGKVPTISIDKTDGCQIYLSPESLDVEIVSSKSSEMNVLLPKGNGDYTEHPVPEQFKTIYKKGHGIVTTPVESTG